MPAALASVVSYSTFGVIFGWKPLFTIPQLTFNNPTELVAYLLLALWAAFLAMLYTRSFYAITLVSPVATSAQGPTGLGRTVNGGGGAGTLLQFWSATSC